MSDAQQSTDSSSGPSATQRLSAGHRSIRVPLRVMLDVQDELTDLAAVLGCLTAIRSLLRVMGEVVEPAEALGTKPSADRIGTAAAELFEGSLDEYLTDAAWTLDRQTDAEVLVDLASAPDTITTCVQLRLYRLHALLRMACTSQK
ncbi:MAG: hypothetical protein IH983_00405 [Planctomycetes bacterium]|nr:hypothetical protein [Planctomycetota bacterium]